MLTLYKTENIGGESVNSNYVNKEIDPSEIEMVDTYHKDKNKIFVVVDNEDRYYIGDYLS